MTDDEAYPPIAPLFPEYPRKNSTMRANIMRIAARIYEDRYPDLKFSAASEYMQADFFNIAKSAYEEFVRIETERP